VQNHGASYGTGFKFYLLFCSTNKNEDQEIFQPIGKENGNHGALAIATILYDGC